MRVSYSRTLNEKNAHKTKNEDAPTEHKYQ